MNEMPQQDEQTPQEEPSDGRSGNPPRKAYRAPQLTRFGSIQEITRGNDLGEIDALADGQPT